MFPELIINSSNSSTNGLNSGVVVKYGFKENIDIPYFKSVNKVIEVPLGFMDSVFYKKNLEGALFDFLKFAKMNQSLVVVNFHLRSFDEIV